MEAAAGTAKRIQIEMLIDVADYGQDEFNWEVIQADLLGGRTDMFVDVVDIF